jgi:hypothetical protein
VVSVTSLRPQSRFFRPEPLLFLLRSSSIALTRLSGPGGVFVELKLFLAVKLCGTEFRDAQGILLVEFMDQRQARPSRNAERCCCLFAGSEPFPPYTAHSWSCIVFFQWLYVVARIPMKSLDFSVYLFHPAAIWPWGRRSFQQK